MKRPRRYRRKSIADRFNAKWVGEPNSGCWLWTASTDKHGYGQIRINQRIKPATHVSMNLIGIQVGPGQMVCHKCDVPPCVNPQHLFIGTQKQNMMDCFLKGRGSAPPTLRGEDNFSSKLTLGDVHKIRLARHDGIKLAVLSEMFGVTPALISMICLRKAWRHT